MTSELSGTRDISRTSTVAVQPWSDLCIPVTRSTGASSSSPSSFAAFVPSSRRRCGSVIGPAPLLRLVEQAFEQLRLLVRGLLRGQLAARAPLVQIRERVLDAPFVG